ncbi:MAG: hypothetical protein U0165_20320 [Polyangiaceae bacterium]
MGAPRKLVLAISGKRFSGKDTLAAAIEKQAARRGLALRRRAFADACKQAFCRSLEVRGVQLDPTLLSTDRNTKEAWRPELTRFTEEQLAVDPQVFARQILDEDHAETVLISDLRLRTEIECLISESQPIFVRLTRSDASRAASGWVFTPGVDTHRTETELDTWNGWDEQVTNDGTLEALDQRAQQLVRRLEEVIAQRHERRSLR